MTQEMTQESMLQSLAVRLRGERVADVEIWAMEAKSLDFRGVSAASIEHAEVRARAVAFIERNLTSHDLTPGSVAEAVHVSRSVLYRLFSGSGGVNRYILRARLDRAWTSLADPAHPRRVSEVAFETGFLSEAHFCRSFRRAFGMSPGRVNGRGASLP